MGQYEIKFACGCTEVKQLYGKIADRERKAKWLATQDCRDCQRERERKEAAEKAKEHGLPALEGTEKQVAWALVIRDAHITELEKEIEIYQRGKITLKQEKIFTAFRAETSAKWWIDNRLSFKSALGKVAKRLNIKRAWKE